MTITRIALALALVTLLSFTASARTATGDLFVIHGIPNLPEPVDVYANGGYLFSFDYNQSAGPLSLDPDTYFIEVKLQGNTVLSATAEVEAGGNYTAIAHLTPPAPGGSPGLKLSLFANNTSAIGPYQTRLTVRHTANAPGVDALFSRGYVGTFPVAKALNLTNGDMPGQFGEIDLRWGLLRTQLFPAGSDMMVFDSGVLFLFPGVSTIVYPIGSLDDGTFTLFVQTIDLI